MKREVMFILSLCTSVCRAFHKDMHFVFNCPAVTKPAGFVTKPADLATCAGALLGPLGDDATADLQALATQLAQEAPQSLAARTTKEYAATWRQFHCCAAISTYFRMAGKATPTDHTACGIVRTLAEKRLHGKPLQRNALEPEDITALARLVEGPENACWHKVATAEGHRQQMKMWDRSSDQSNGCSVVDTSRAH
ncbi:hypothetical protein VOLCADRAFT_99472 [Volvox carteri f. nagariensis]|uniref:Uncharacterized protein n=1 Tax=Volvox carteri f. nagariensis TaxID=3068 RepID=D8UHW1_VOLCA|nr:uncharacterized protein VOLCADRAFT_99472 [Volvox carteri f. nagariensis]EFJ40688.1 hypothetical protein VOLCADRAFT_99472 [Volvox carteri f. nagariensis]|eukprot:XP_002958234.1 hypothetical protein VOLCADRAFT_99472 [Volvox carteri f. nagariensis]